MEKFLGILLIIIFSLVVLKWLGRLFLPLLMGWMVKKLMNKTFQQQQKFGGFGGFNNFQQEPQQHNREGEVFVENTSGNLSNAKKSNKGEYVDFEEIKD